MRKYDVPCGWTRSTRASKDTVKGHHKRGYVWMLIVDVFLDGMHVYSLDMWMINQINATTLTIKGNIIDSPNQIRSPRLMHDNRVT